MILVLAGTRDGRDIIRELSSRRLAVYSTTVSAYGGELAAQAGAQVEIGALSAERLRELIRNQGIRWVVDATHPYAANISALAQRVCEETGTAYIRYERPPTVLPPGVDIRMADDWRQAAQIAAELGDTLFLTTGSRHLAEFMAAPAVKGKRVVVRVLPDPESLRQCFALGLTARDIIAMQGPFSPGLNIALFRDYGAEVVVLKDSGTIGGTESKLHAAATLEIPVVMVKRPALVYPRLVRDMETLITLIQGDRQ